MTKSKEYGQILCSTYSTCLKNIRSAAKIVAKKFKMSENDVLEIMALPQIEEYEVKCKKKPNILAILEANKPKFFYNLCLASKCIRDTAKCLKTSRGRKNKKSMMKTSCSITYPKAPFKWAGGKRRLFKHFEDIFFPPGEIKVFVDMFCGATSVSLLIASRYPNAKIILNDKNKELIDMYRAIRNSYPNFERRYKEIVKKCPLKPEPRKKYYYKIRHDYCKKRKILSKERIAASLFFMLKTNFGGFWNITKKYNNLYSTPPGGMTFTKKFIEDLEPIRNFHLFLKRCIIRNSDFGKLSRWAKPGTYYYADPPYRNTTVVYQGGFDDNVQKRLIDYLKLMAAKGSWIAESNRDTGDKFWEKNVRFGKKNYIENIKYTAGRGKTTKGREILITNF